LVAKKGGEKPNKRKFSYRVSVFSTLDSGIDVGQGKNVGPGTFGKKNKHR
jgi:hypothetical protein